MTGLKLALIGAIFGGVTGVFGLVVAGVIAGATFGAAAMWWYRTLVRPSIEAFQDARDLLKVLTGLPEWMRGVDERLQGLEGHASATKEAAVATARELDVKHRPAPPHTPRI